MITTKQHSVDFVRISMFFHLTHSHLSQHHSTSVTVVDKDIAQLLVSSKETHKTKDQLLNSLRISVHDKLIEQTVTVKSPQQSAVEPHWLPLCVQGEEQRGHGGRGLLQW